MGTLLTIVTLGVMATAIVHYKMGVQPFSKKIFYGLLALGCLLGLESFLPPTHEPVGVLVRLLLPFLFYFGLQKLFLRHPVPPLPPSS